jgi:hypothetical protein
VRKSRNLCYQIVVSVNKTLVDSWYWTGETRDGLKIKPAEARQRQAESVRKGSERAAQRRGVKV